MAAIAPRRRSPRIAAAAALVCGPLGFFYLGWRYGVLLSLVILPWFVTLLVINPPVAFIVIAADLVVLAVEARRIAKASRGSGSGKKATPVAPSRFTLPLFAFTSILLTFAVVNITLIALLFAATLWSQDRAGWAAAMLLIVAPLSGFITALIFRKTADVLDDLVTDGNQNPFRSGWRRRLSRAGAA